MWQTNTHTDSWTSRTYLGPVWFRNMMSIILFQCHHYFSFSFVCWMNVYCSCRGRAGAAVTLLQCITALQPAVFCIITPAKVGRKAIVNLINNSIVHCIVLKSHLLAHHQKSSLVFLSEHLHLLYESWLRNRKCLMIGGRTGWTDCIQPKYII